MQEHVQMLQNTFLCEGLSAEEFQYFVTHTSIQLKTFCKNEFVFMETEKPQRLFMLIDGSISIYKDTMSGKFMPIADIEESGDIFGEVYLYMQRPQYDINAIAKKESRVLLIESKIFQIVDDEVPFVYYKIAKNLLTMFAKKAFLLNTKLQVLNSGSLRQRIVRYFMNCDRKDGVIKISTTREKMAEFLNTTRPSLSRELANMQKEGLIQMKGKFITLLNDKALDEYL